MAKWTMTGEGETISNGSSKNLKIGAYPYKITDAARKELKSDPTQKHIVVGLSLIGESYTCTTFFSVEADNDVRREIAMKELRTLWQASGNTGDLSESALKKLIGTCVIIEAKETKKGDKTYVNIASISAYDGDVEEEEAEEEEAEEEEEDEEEEEEPAKPAKSAGKKKPWE